jgi:hypothetical protein
MLVHILVHHMLLAGLKAPSAWNQQEEQMLFYEQRA